MGQTASEIESQIDDQRESLGSNLNELENRFRSATDWRSQFRSHPLTFIGVAFGGGVMLATMMDGHSRRSDRYDVYPRNRKSGASSDTAERARETHTPSPAMEKARAAVENIKGAMVGIAIARVKDYADKIVPGFSKYYEDPTERRSSATI